MINKLMVIEQREVLGMDFKIYGDIDNPLFLAKDIASWINYDSTSINKLVGLVEESEKVRSIIPTLGGNQESWFLTEDGLYEVLMQSRKPIAKEFKKQVKQILKDIRKHGMYATENTIEKMINNPDFTIQLLIKLKEEKALRLVAEAEKELVTVERDTALKTVDLLTHVNKLYNTTEIAKELGLKSANVLNRFLNEKGIQYKSGGTWVLYSKYSDLEYVSIKQRQLENGTVIYDRKWTQRGREFILNLCNLRVYK
jgi:prophage antirepressor-like protein